MRGAEKMIEQYRKQASDIVAQMTMDEKLHMCTGNSYWTTYPLERFGIKECVMSDGPHGIRKVKERDHLGQAVNERATGFPTSVTMGATWNKELLYEVGEAIGKECQNLGVHILLGPAVNMKRSVLGGRNFEYISEDPILAGKLAAEMVKGLQDQGIAACVKHYACNNSETQRMTLNAVIDKRTLHEYYLKVFETIVKESHPLSVMGAYNKVNGTYACENKELLIDILREQWGFNGITISDWLAVEEPVNAINNGLNIEMPHNPLSYDKLREGYRSNTLDEKELNQRVEEIIALMLLLQKNEQPQSVEWEKHKKVAQRVASEGMVLLKNNNNILPLDIDQISTIGIIGDFAVHPRTQGGGSSKVVAEEHENLLQAIRRMSQGKIDVKYAQGYNLDGTTSEELLEEAGRIVSECDQVIILVGLPESYESEGYDRTTMKMPQGHLDLISTICDIREDVVVILSNGAAIELPFISRVDAVIETWLLGQESIDVIANLIMNHVQPSGRLPETFPLSLADDSAGVHLAVEEGVQYYNERMLVGYRHYDTYEKEVTFPFGYGLSYTEFAYGDFQISKKEITEKDHVRISLKVKNIGNYEGYAVVQLYVGNLQRERLHPKKELKDFQKILLQVGEEQEIVFTLTKEAFECYSDVFEAWIVEKGSYEIMIGTSSQDILRKETVVMELEEIKERKLEFQSTLEEWLNHSKGRVLAETMLSEYTGFGMITGKRAFSDLLPFVQQIMLEMPMPRLVISSNGSFAEEELKEMLLKIEEEK